MKDQFVRRSFFLLDPDTDIPSEDVFGATIKKKELGIEDIPLK